MARQAGTGPLEKGHATAKGRTSRKAAIVAATERLLRERGLAGVTTRAIAEAVSCSEGAISVHFSDRLDLLLAVLQDSLPAMLVPLHALDNQIGKATPSKNLAAVVGGLLQFHDRITPMLCGLMMDQELLQRFRQSLLRAGKGPHRGVATIARYIEREQELGRIHTSVDARSAASVLMASSFFQVFTAQLFGAGRKMDVKRLVELALRATMS